jgi:hypothetical protein
MIGLPRSTLDGCENIFSLKIRMIFQANPHLHSTNARTATALGVVDCNAA